MERTLDNIYLPHFSEDKTEVLNGRQKMLIAIFYFTPIKHKAEASILYTLLHDCLPVLLLNLQRNIVSLFDVKKKATREKVASLRVFSSRTEHQSQFCLTFKLLIFQPCQTYFIVRITDGDC